MDTTTRGVVTDRGEQPLDDDGREFPRAGNNLGSRPRHLFTKGVRMKLIILKSTWYVAALAAFSATVAWAQSPAAPTGDGPTWAWMAALFLLLLVAMGKWIFHTVNKDIARVEKANEDTLRKSEHANTTLRLELQTLRAKITEDHLDRDATRDLINMVVRIAVSDQMKTELQTIQGQLNNIVMALATMTPQHHKPGEG